MMMYLHGMPHLVTRPIMNPPVDVASTSFKLPLIGSGMLPQRCAQVHSFGQDMEVFCASSAWNGSLISVPWKLALLNSPPEPINN